MEAQAQANIQQQESSAQLEMQKKASEAQTELTLEKTKSKLQSDRMQMEAALKKELMDHEFEIALRLKKMELDNIKDKEIEKEDRKDKRTKIEATQESELIDQKENQKPPKNFEESSDDNIGGLDLSSFGMNI